jgi:magnesium transporter
MPLKRKPYPASRGDVVVNCVAYKEGQRFGDIEIEDISEVLKEQGTFVWLGLRESNLDVLAKIQQEFGLHELAIEDTRSAHQRPKLEEYGDSAFVVLHPAHLFDDELQFGETNLFVGQRFLVSVRHGPSMGYQKVRERCESMPQQLAKGPGFALYAIIDYVVDNYVPVIDGLHKRFEQLEAEIFEHRVNDKTLENLYELKRELLLLRAATSPLLDICNGLMRFHPHIIPKDVQPYFRDVSDHVKRINQTIDSMREMLTAAMQVHLSLVTVRQNEVVKRLAGWGAILAIPTMVFSLYGMNFKVMPELEWPLGYPSVMGGVVIGCIMLYFKLKRVGWL